MTTTKGNRLNNSVARDDKLPVLDSDLGMQLLAASPDCVKLIAPDGTLRFMNTNGLCLLEIENFDTVEGQCWQDMWPKENAAVIATAIADAKSGRIGRFAGFCPSAKGAPKWWEVVVSPVYNAGGELVWLLSVSRDVTEQKRTETKLRRSEERFRALADNIAQFAWMADASGSIFWYNQRWFDYTGTALDTMRGDGWKAVHHPDHIERVVQKFTSCVADGSEWEDTFPLRSVDGNYRWFLSRAMPIRDDNGRIKLWCGTNTDITDQRQASQRLRQLARLIELSHEAISVRSATDGILLWNRGCEELYGYSQSEALGQNSNLLLKTENALPASELENLLQTEGTWSGEMRRTAKDGTQVWVDGRKQVIRLGDGLIILETDRDITERRKADEIRQLLISELNHRVKNTLAIVQSFATQTARNARTMGDFVTSFNGRLHSLSGAHNALTDENWSGARIRPLITSQIGAIAGSGGRMEVSGPDVFVPPQAALHMTLVLHELATNAVKHGALSNECGRVAINWTVTQASQRQLVMTWTERGGPPVTRPQARGFGLSLIERTGQLPHIKTEIAFEPAGIVCLISAHLEESAPAGTPFFNPAKRPDAS